MIYHYKSFEIQGEVPLQRKQDAMTTSSYPRSSVGTAPCTVGFPRIFAFFDLITISVTDSPSVLISISSRSAQPSPSKPPALDEQCPSPLRSSCEPPNDIGTARSDSVASGANLRREIRWLGLDSGQICLASLIRIIMVDRSFPSGRFPLPTADISYSNNLTALHVSDQGAGYPCDALFDPGPSCLPFTSHWSLASHRPICLSGSAVIDYITMCLDGILAILDLFCVPDDAWWRGRAYRCGSVRSCCAMHLTQDETFKESALKRE